MSVENTLDKVLVSGCLLGKKVRYNGQCLSIVDSILEQWKTEGRVVSICPEVDAGMSIPRASAEILNGDGNDVWKGTASVVESGGKDVTLVFKRGAQMALAICKKHKIRVAVLTESSPSCGSTTIYDGNFRNRKMAGIGVTTALLQDNGIAVFSQHNILGAQKALLQITR